MDPSAAGVDEDNNVLRWILGDDRVLIQAVAVAVGVDGLQTLVEHFKSQNAWVNAAKTELAAAALLDSWGDTLIGGGHSSARYCTPLPAQAAVGRGAAGAP